MATVIRRSTVHPRVVGQARAIVGAASRHDKAGQLQLIRDWVADNTKWVPDPIGGEYLVTPEVMLTRVGKGGPAIGDCDDVAMLYGALARAVGLPVKLTAVAFAPRRDFRHVYASGWDGQGWHPADTTKPALSTAIPWRWLSLEV